MSLCPEILESGDLFIMFATFFQFLILGVCRKLKSSTLSEATSSLCSESSSESILLYFDSLLDSVTGLDIRFAAGASGVMVGIDIDLTFQAICDHFQQKMTFW